MNLRYPNPWPSDEFSTLFGKEWRVQLLHPEKDKIKIKQLLKNKRLQSTRRKHAIQGKRKNDQACGTIQCSRDKNMK